MDIIVSKFGGSSIKDAKGVRNCIEILKKNSNRRMIIVSAMGKTTNELERIIQAKEKVSLLNELFEKHKKIARDLGIYFHCQVYFDRLQEEANKCLNELGQKSTNDHFLAYGEKLSSFIFYRALQESIPGQKSVLLDSTRIIRTDSYFGEANPKFDISFKNIRNALKNDKGEFYIAQGFLGSDDLRRTTTLGREGSDFSASLFAAGLEAKTLEIWTDVSGVYNMDPRIYKDAKKCSALSYNQAHLLAKYGMKILYPRTMEPLLGKNISVFVGNSKKPLDGGTIISPYGEESCSRLGISVTPEVSQIKIDYDPQKSSEDHFEENMEALLKDSMLVPLLSTAHSLYLKKSKLTTDFVGKLKEFASVDVFPTQTILTLIGTDLEELEAPLKMLIKNWEKKHISCELILQKEAAIFLQLGPKIDNEFYEDLYKLFFNE